MLYLYSRSSSFADSSRQLLKRQLQKWTGKIDGPAAVLSSLLEGIKECGEDFRLNDWQSDFVPVAGIISGVNTVIQALHRKQQKKMDQLIAGPNIVITPKDCGGILTDDRINKVIVPSQWVKDFYISQAPELKNKIFVWSAGVSLPTLTQRPKQFDFLIYNKVSHLPLAGQITDYLQEKNFSYKILNYGSFKQREYFDLLYQSRFEIYLSESESQGLAMFEAWARGIPTFVWDRQKWEISGFVWEQASSSPYLSSDSGDRFANFEEFEAKLDLFINSKYNPRTYVEANFTNKISAKKYLDILYFS